MRAVEAVRARPVTPTLAALLVAWYGVQWAVAALGTDVETLRWLFTVESATTPTPGWLLSGFSHAYALPVGHLGANVAMLLVFGGAAEAHLRRRQYLALFVGAGVAGSLAEVWLHPARAPVNGASSAVLALAAFATVHLARDHDRSLSVPPAGETPTLPWLYRVVRTALVVAVPLALVLQVGGQLAGVVPAGRSATVSHAVGVGAGVALVYLHPVLGSPPCDAYSSVSRRRST